MSPAVLEGESYAVVMLPPVGARPARYWTVERISLVPGRRAIGPGLPDRDGHIAMLRAWNDRGVCTDTGQLVAPRQEAILRGIKLLLGLRLAPGQPLGQSAAS